MNLFSNQLENQSGSSRANPSSKSRTRLGEYLNLSRTPGYSLLFVVPLVLLYEFGILVATNGNVRISADIWIKKVLGLVGIGDTMVVAILFILAALGALYFERRRGTPIRPSYFGMMFGESLIYAFISGYLVSNVVSGLLRMQWPPQLQNGNGISLTEQLVLSLGAGFYEELFFRLILVWGLYGIVWGITWLVARDRIESGKRMRYVVAVIIGALIFSWVHYTGPYGDPFQLDSFTFRFLMGLLLNGILIWRGFGVAAMTHALYDVVVTLS